MRFVRCSVQYVTGFIGQYVTLQLAEATGELEKGIQKQEFFLPLSFIEDVCSTKQSVLHIK